MAIRTNFLEVDVTSDSGDPVKGDMPGIAPASTSFVPDGKPVEPQIQGETPLTAKTAADIASTNGIIPEDIPHKEYDKLATEAMAKISLADIIDEGKLAAYVYNKLTGKLITEAPEPKPGKALFETSDASSAMKDSKMDAELKKLTKDSGGGADNVSGMGKFASSVGESAIKKINKAVSEVHIPHPEDMEDIRKLEAAIDAEYEKHYMPALEQLAQRDPSGALVHEAAKKIVASKAIAKKKIIDKYIDNKNLARKKSKDTCPKCGKPKGKCECGGTPGFVK